MAHLEWVICPKCKHSQYNYGEKQSCEMCESEDCEDQRWPRCPHCFHAVEDWGEEMGNSNDGDEVDMDCGWCEKPFKTMMHISATFTSVKQERNERKR